MVQKVNCNWDKRQPLDLAGMNCKAHIMPHGNTFPLTQFASGPNSKCCWLWLGEEGLHYLKECLLLHEPLRPLRSSLESLQWMSLLKMTFRQHLVSGIALTRNGSPSPFHPNFNDSAYNLSGPFPTARFFTQQPRDWNVRKSHANVHTTTVSPNFALRLHTALRMEPGELVP